MYQYLNFLLLILYCYSLKNITPAQSFELLLKISSTLYFLKQKCFKKSIYLSIASNLKVLSSKVSPFLLLRYFLNTIYSTLLERVRPMTWLVITASIMYPQNYCHLHWKGSSDC